uniref:Serpin domain-containing protein n=1 Tax=Brassica oleracea var. oleracea TaxID=109376 RepID=A0A0D2ZVV0_BRAOL
MAPPKEKKQKLSTSETISPSLSKMKKKKNKRKKRPPPISKVNVEKAMKKQNDVAMFLTEKVISAVAKNSNFVFSPASINAALTMVAASSKEEQLTSSILSFLRSYSMDELKAVFSEIATIVLADGSASSGPKISNAEEVREEVNAWASSHTNGLIKVILPPGSVTSETASIFGNAIYFKGTWEEKFPNHTPIKQVEVGVFRIPKFKIDFGFEASKAFNGLNLDSLSLNHKALVEIDEDGAEAAAVTVLRCCSGGRGFSSGRRIDFVADHPFLFMIREDKTGTVLFVGQIFDPSKSASA